jgi:hypothetical protein
MGSTSASSKYNWSKTGPGRYERPMDPVEKFTYIWANQAHQYGRTSISLHSCIEYQTTRSKEDMAIAFRAAWVAIKHYHPSFACHFVEERCVFHVNESLDTWVNDTFHVVHDETPEIIFAKQRMPARPNLYIFPDTNQVMISCRHEYSDGIGTLIFFDTLFKYVENSPALLSQEEVVKKLSLPLFAQASIPEDESPTPEAQRFLKETIEVLQTPNIQIPTSKDLTAPPSDCAAEILGFSEEETSAIIRGSKSAGLTVTQAVNTALALSLRTLVAEGKTSDQAKSASEKAPASDHYLAIIPINARKIVAPEYVLDLASIHVWGNHTIVHLLPEATFASLSVYYKRRYEQLQMKNLDLTGAIGIADIYTQGISMLHQNPNGETAPSLSSLGIADQYMGGSYGKTQVLNYRLMMGVCEASYRLLSWTYKGRFTISANYNTAFQERADMRKGLQLLKEELFKGLGIAIE